MKIQKISNSLLVTIPYAMARLKDLKQGDEVIIYPDDKTGNLIIKKV